MPFTTVKLIEGVFSTDQKAQLIENITEGMIDVYGEGMRDKTWVVIVGDANKAAFEKHITNYHKDRLPSVVLAAERAQRRADAS